MDFLVLLGRILFGTLAISSAVWGHFAHTDGLAGYAEARGVKTGARALPDHRQSVRPVSGRRWDPVSPRLG